MLRPGDVAAEHAHGLGERADLDVDPAVQPEVVDRAAAVLAEVERDGLGQRLRILAHAIERVAAVGLGRPAPAGSDRIDHHQIGEAEPGLRVVL